MFLKQQKKILNEVEKNDKWSKIKNKTKRSLEEVKSCQKNKFLEKLKNYDWNKLKN